jgi:heat-inducible transcriptional repressor
MDGNTMPNKLSERAQHLFKVLVELYINGGQPVGSRTLARGAGLELSPATIRNVMADLEDMGLVRAPHTSAGRVPTPLGFRLFIDTLLRVKDIPSAEARRVCEDLGSEMDIHRLLEKTSQILSEVTSFAGLVMLPLIRQQSFRHVEFLPLSDDRVLAIIVVNQEEVQNRIIKTERRYSPAELQEAANYLNQAFGGRELRAVREKLLNEMAMTKEEMTRLMQTVIEMGQKAFEVNDKPADYLLAGETKLMGVHELANVEKLRRLFDAFTQKRDVLHLLDQAMEAHGVQIFIGEESGYQFLDGCSLVTSPYEADGRVLGVLGVIGPTRMAYERVIPIVDLTARVLGSALKSLH